VFALSGDSRRRIINLLADTKQALHIALIGLVHNGKLHQSFLSAFGLFGQDVIFEGVLSFDLTGSRNVESFLGSGIGFHLRHLATIFIV
jgi:hypothetical protein